MGLKENLHKERIRDLPLREAILIKPETSVGEAIGLMRAKKLGCSVIVDEENRPVGVFTERTVIDLLLDQHDDLGILKVGEYRERDWYKLKLSDQISMLMDTVQKDDARFVVVIDDDGRVAGLTGQKGLSEYVAEHFPKHVIAQRSGSKPGLEKREGA